ncbi:5305_t:CDS:1, partial [Diversispora eburnea]
QHEGANRQKEKNEIDGKKRKAKMKWKRKKRRRNKTEGIKKDVTKIEKEKGTREKQ